MEAIILVIHCVLALALIAVVLLQKSEGGGLGIGGGGGGMGNMMTARGTANLLTRTTVILAAAFFTTTITLAVLAGAHVEPRSIVDTVADELEEGAAAPTPAVPQVPASE